ncbi:MAG: hypothetical protein ACYC63_13045 [Armatimonadota bacterium]
MLSDRIRSYVNEAYLAPARDRGEASVTIRAGDVHAEMGLSARLPAVCAAIGSDVFEREYRVHRTSVEGPLNEANCLLTFGFVE